MKIRNSKFIWLLAVLFFFDHNRGYIFRSGICPNKIQRQKERKE